MFDPSILASLTQALQQNPDMFAQMMGGMGVMPPDLATLDQVGGGAGAGAPGIASGPPPMGLPASNPGMPGIAGGAPPVVGGADPTQPAAPGMLQSLMAPSKGGAPPLGQSLSALGGAAKAIGGSSDIKPVFSGGVTGAQKAPDMTMGKSVQGSQQQALMELLARMKGGSGMVPPLGFSLGR